MVTITLELEDSFIHDAIEHEIDKDSDAKELLFDLMNKMVFLELKHQSSKKDVMLFLNSNAIPDENVDKFRSVVSQAYMLCRMSDEK